ncbi:MAG TPA: hypothetical protein VFB13_10000 [Reyranella sp.]|nr:hypothetical protein [Reyranella sp.]
MSAVSDRNGGGRDSIRAILAWAAITAWFLSVVWLLLAVATDSQLYASRLGDVLGRIPFQLVVVGITSLLAGWAPGWLVRRHLRVFRDTSGIIQIRRASVAPVRDVSHQQHSATTPLPDARRIWILAAIDVAALWFVSSQLVMALWVSSNPLKYQHVHPLPWWAWLAVLQTPLVAFGILWLYFRKLNSLRRCWGFLAERSPTLAKNDRLLALLALASALLLCVSLLLWAKFDG